MLDMNMLVNLSPNIVARDVALSMIIRFGPIVVVSRLFPLGRIRRRRRRRPSSGGGGDDGGASCVVVATDSLRSSSQFTILPCNPLKYIS